MRRHHNDVTPEEDAAWNEADDRMNVIGQNGNDGQHYHPATMEARMQDAMPKLASEFAMRAADLLAERGQTYDRKGSERSMGRTVAAFNAITGKELTEWEGWLLMSLLKRVRQHSSPFPHRDSAEDDVAYAALEAECLMADNAEAHRASEASPVQRTVSRRAERRK